MLPSPFSPAFLFTLITLAVPLVPFHAAAQDGGREILGQFRDWTAVAYTDGAKVRTCMAWSDPQTVDGAYTSRGEPFIFVTHRPSEGERGKLSTEAGYTFASDATVVAIIGDERFTLKPQASTAQVSDSELVAAMRAGSTMQVEGTADDGTTTTDSYSLLGFTAASKALDEACP